MRNLLVADPSDTFCHYGLAQEYAKQGKLAKAVDAYNEVIRLDPSYAYAYFHKARMLIELGQASEASDVLRTGVQRALEAGDSKAARELQELQDSLA